MSRYVTKKHGMVIGSDNLFSFRKEEGGLACFPCIVGVRSLHFDNYSSLHTGLRSLAEQLLFYGVEVDPDMERGWGGTTAYRLKQWWINWLDANCPGWGYPPISFSDRVPNLFFAKRKHALAFTRKVEEILKGEEYL